MRIGKLKTRLRHYVKQEATTPSAGQTVTYTPQDYIRCNLRGASADEMMVGGGVQSNQQWMVVARWRSDVVARNRLRRESDGLTLEILGVVDPDGDQRVMHVTCATVI